jgi:DNA-directed RNA polymerase subunit RPC12/RpoP
MEYKGPFAGIGHASALLSLINSLPVSPYYSDFPMPKVKDHRPVTVIACSQCGKRDVTLKKVGYNEYKCLKCSKEAE